METRVCGGWAVSTWACGEKLAILSLAQPGQDEELVVPASELVAVAEFPDPVYPGLKSVARVELGGDKPFQTLINAENYHALQTLLYTHEGRVDAIYIDPHTTLAPKIGSTTTTMSTAMMICTGTANGWR